MGRVRYYTDDVRIYYDGRLEPGIFLSWKMTGDYDGTRECIIPLRQSYKKKDNDVPIFARVMRDSVRVPRNATMLLSNHTEN